MSTKTCVPGNNLILHKALIVSLSALDSAARMSSLCQDMVEYEVQYVAVTTSNKFVTLTVRMSSKSVDIVFL